MYGDFQLHISKLPVGRSLQDLEACDLASFPGLPHFYLLFAFTIFKTHRSGRLAVSSAPVYYCECKWKVKIGNEAIRDCLQLCIASCTVNHGLIPYPEPMYAPCIAEEVRHG